eukprot:gene9282-6524_t
MSVSQFSLSLSLSLSLRIISSRMLVIHSSLPHLHFWCRPPHIYIYIYMLREDAGRPLTFIAS